MNNLIKSTNPFAEVEIQPVQIAGKEVNKVGVMVKDDAGEMKLAGILSSDYNLIKNSRAHEVALDIFSRSEMRFSSLKTVWDGRKYLEYFISDPVDQIDNGHPVSLGALLRNTYDGTGSFGFEMFLCNMHCTNQYVMRNRMGWFQIRHSGDSEFQLDDGLMSLRTGLGNMKEILPAIASFRKISATTTMITDAVQKTKLPQTKWGAVLTQFALEESSKFGLYQALTYVASHQMTGLPALDVGNSISEHFLRS